MRRIDINELQPGMKIARSLYYDYGGTMLTAGAVLNASMIVKLREFGYQTVFVHDEETEDLIFYEYIDEKSRQQLSCKIRELYTDIQREIRSQFPKSAPPPIPAERTSRDDTTRIFKKMTGHFDLRTKFMFNVENMIQNMLADREILQCVGAIKTASTYLYDHSIEVAIHSAIIAKRLGFPRSEIREIILGAILHDIGYIFIPEDITQKRGKLSDKERDLLKLHTTYGYYLLKDRDDISLLAAHVSYQHHERQDGGGFPRGLNGTNKVVNRIDSSQEPIGMIHRFANIVAVPNYYDMLISELPYKKAMAPDEAIAQVRRAAGDMLNREVVEAFLSYVPVYPMGTEVALSGGKYAGCRGVVSGVNKENLAKPKIRLLRDRRQKKMKPIDIDASTEKVQIKALWR